MKRHVVWMVVGLAVWGWSGVAASQEEGDSKLIQPAASSAESADAKEALRLYTIGELQFEGGEYAASAATFEKAFTLDPNPIIAFNIARSWENDGQIDKARAAYKLSLKLQPPEDVQARAKAALVRLDRLEEQIKTRVAEAPATTGRLAVSANVQDAQLVLDGAPAGGLPYESELPPGLHRLEISAPGFVTQTREVEVPLGRTLPLTVVLEEQPTVSWMGWTGLGLVVAGGAGIGLALAFDQEAQEAFDEAQTLEVQRNPSQLMEVRESGESDQELSQVLWWGGLGLATAGLTLFAIDLGINLTSGEAAPAPQATLHLGPGSGGVQVRW